MAAFTQKLKTSVPLLLQMRTIWSVLSFPKGNHSAEITVEDVDAIVAERSANWTSKKQKISSILCLR